MEIIEALKYKYELNRYIEKSLQLEISYPEIWEAITDNNEGYTYFLSFLNESKIGPIWLKKPYGQEFLKWQTGVENG